MKFDINKIALFLCFVFSTINAFSQSADKTLEFENKRKIKGSAKIDFITDSTHSKVAILSHFEGLSIVHLLDASLNEIGQFEVATKEKAFFKAGFFKGDSLFFYFFTDTYKETVLTTCGYSVSGKVLTQINTDISFYNENALDLFVLGNELFMLTAKNGMPAFNIHSFDYRGQKKRSIAYNFNGIVSVISNQPVQGFFSLDDKRPALVKSKFEPDISSSILFKRKIYITNDSLYILANGEAAVTEVYALSLRKAGQKYRSINHPSAAGITESGGKKIKDNSFLYDGVLFYAAVNADSLRLVLHDFATGKELQSFAAGRKDTIDFKSTPILKHESSPKKNIEKLIFPGDKTSNLIDAILKNGLVIYAEDSGSFYEVMVGAYRLFSERTEMPINSVLQPNEIGQLPKTGLYDFSEEKEIIEFMTVLDKQDKSFVTNAGQFKSLQRKKAEVADKQRVNMFTLHSLKVGNHQLFVFYNSLRKHLKLFQWKDSK
jgi:hypothetical protein